MITYVVTYLQAKFLLILIGLVQRHPVHFDCFREVPQLKVAFFLEMWNGIKIKCKH